MRGLFPLSPAAKGALFYFGYFGAGAAYTPFMTVFFARRGLSGSEIGLLAAVGPVMAFIVAPMLTALADRRRWRVRMLAAALAGTALGLLAVGFQTTFEGFLPVFALLCAVGSPMGPLADSLVTGMAATHGLSYGKMRLWGSVSWAVVAAACGVIWQQLSFVWMFPLASLLYLATVPVAGSLHEDRTEEVHARVPLTRVIGDIRFRVLLVASFLMGTGMSMSSTFSGIYLDKLGGGQTLVGVFAGVVALCELPVMHWSDRIMGRLGGPMALALSYAFFASSYIGLFLIKEPLLLLVPAVFQGLGFGLFLTMTIKLVSAWSPAGWATTSQGLLSAVLWGIAPVLGGPLGGLIYDASGVGVVFIVCAGVGVAAVGVLMLARLAGAFSRAENPSQG